MVAHTLDELQIKIVGKRLFKFIDPIVDYPGFLAAGGTTTQWLEASECYERGILPLRARQISQNNVLENSIELESGKYAQYQVKEYVDVKNRDPGLWNLVGNGKSYPTIFEGDVVVRPGCGFMWRDEGMGCLRVEAHEGHYAKLKLISNKCMRPQCPVDYEFWAAREAGRIEERFRRVPKLSNVNDITAEARTQMGVPIHVVISVPECDAGLMDLVTLEVKRRRGRRPGKFDPSRDELVKVNHFEKLRQMVNKIAEKVGFLGGCVIFHPFANDNLGEEDPGIKISINQKTGKIDLDELKAYIERINFRNAKPGEDVKQTRIWFIRPHFHLIGYGWIKNVEYVSRKTGYVIRNLGVRDSVFMTALYQLSHAGYKYGHHTVSWIGCMSTRLYCELDPTPELPVMPLRCPECDAKMYPIHWVGSKNSSVLDEYKEGMRSVPAQADLENLSFDDEECKSLSPAEYEIYLESLVWGRWEKVPAVWIYRDERGFLGSADMRLLPDLSFDDEECKSLPPAEYEAYLDSLMWGRSDYVPYYVPYPRRILVEYRNFLGFLRWAYSDSGSLVPDVFRGGYWMSGLRNRSVKPTDEEKEWEKGVIVKQIELEVSR